jgi:DNA repair protein RecO (recombination protein O)
MARTTIVTAIVSHRIPYHETDNILTLITREQGKMSAIARGARKAVSRMSGICEHLNVSKIALVTGRSLGIVTQAEIVRAHTMLNEDLPRLAHGLYFAELTEQYMIEDAPHAELFDLLDTALSLLETNLQVDRIARWFELAAMSLSGYALNLSDCGACGRAVSLPINPDTIFRFSSRNGSVLCDRHDYADDDNDQSMLSGAALIWMRRLQQIDVDSVSDLSTITDPTDRAPSLARLALRRFIRYHADRDLRSIPFLDHVSRG